MKPFILLSAAVALPMSLAAQKERPNILFAFGDDYGHYASIYAQVEKDNDICKLIETPNFDRVASEGVLFTNAHVPAPSSTPCRSSLLSGQYFWRTGMGAYLHGDWDGSVPTFPLILEADGYHMGCTYKVWGPGTNVDAPIGGKKNKYQRHGSKFCQFSQNASKAPDGDTEKAKQKLYDEVAANFKDFLEARQDGEPFCYWWGPTNTHRSWVKGSGKKLWDIDPDKLKGIMPEFLPDEPEIREDFADYLGECLAFDAGLGVLISILEETGELDNTIIVVSGDHGIPGFPRGKCNLYELGTNVGLAIRYPQSVPGGRVVTDFVNLMDLAPTFLEFGQAEVPQEMTGRSLKGVLESGKKGQVDPERTYVVTGRERHYRWAREENLPYPQRAIVTKDYKYIRNLEPSRWPIGTVETGFGDLDGGPTKDWFVANYNNPDYAFYMNLAFGKRPYEELYDLRKDPDEIRNLAWEPGYQKVRKELSDKLDKVMVETGDPRTEPKLCIYDTPTFTNLNLDL